MNKKIILRIIIVGIIFGSIGVYAGTKFYASDVSVTAPTGSNLGSNATLQDSLDELYSIADNNDTITNELNSLKEDVNNLKQSIKTVEIPITKLSSRKVTYDSVTGFYNPATGEVKINISWLSYTSIAGKIFNTYYSIPEKYKPKASAKGSGVVATTNGTAQVTLSSVGTDKVYYYAGIPFVATNGYIYNGVADDAQIVAIIATITYII